MWKACRTHGLLDILCFLRKKQGGKEMSLDWQSHNVPAPGQPLFSHSVHRPPQNILSVTEWEVSHQRFNFLAKFYTACQAWSWCVHSCIVTYFLVGYQTQLRTLKNTMNFIKTLIWCLLNVLFWIMCHLQLIKSYLGCTGQSLQCLPLPLAPWQSILMIIIIVTGANIYWVRQTFYPEVPAVSMPSLKIPP